MNTTRNELIIQLTAKGKANTPAAANLIDKAAKILQRDGVALQYNQNFFNVDGTPRKFIATVESQTKKLPYVIYATPHDGYICGCEFFTKAKGKRPMNKTQPLCTHITAASMESTLQASQPHAASEPRGNRAKTYSNGRTRVNGSKQVEPGLGAAARRADRNEAEYRASDWGKSRARMQRFAKCADAFEAENNRIASLNEFNEMAF